ncbi:RNA-binding protein 39 isoform X1 [Coffea eugenioides]|uniref:RNA-binding protein 39 isoform X1 n=1 Tax=Coffea eugenioides TaxID=49369 RepID=UPI000F60FB63|nr:RNA-binding protein 39 isoform X1 [Coffea eugenioides]
MEFDEFDDYSEKTADNPETSNGSDQVDKSGGGQDPIKRPMHKSDHHHQRVKRSRTREEFHEDEEERSSSYRHHSPSRDRERSGRERYRSSRESKDRDKHKSSKKERDGDKIKESDRERDTNKGEDSGRRGRGREDERQRGRERNQDLSNRTSHSERHLVDGEREESRDREKNGDREYGGRERQSQLQDGDRESRRFKEKKEEVAEPEADPEHDQRTVFAYQISLQADERDVYEFFSRAGKVRDVRLIVDHISRRSKGIGYIEFYDVMSVPMAIALSGQPLLGQSVMVKPSEAEKNLVQSTASVAAGDTDLICPYSGGARRLYVDNLHSNIKEDQLRQVFEPFGTVELVQLPPDLETGHSSRYGFVQFSRLEDARAALSLDGQLDIAGRVMKVSAVTDQTLRQEVGANAGDFGDDEGGGLSLSAESLTLLMQKKLDHTRITSSGAGSVGSPVVDNPGFSAPAAPVLGAAPEVSPFVPFGQIPVPALAGWPAAGLSLPSVTFPSIDTIGIPSECLLLKNMFDPKLESEPEFDQDIKDDVEDECSKFGKLKHIYVDKKSDGLVYLRFENNQAAIAAQRALHGRWFAGKMILATFMVPQNYEVTFPQSK